MTIKCREKIVKRNIILGVSIHKVSLDIRFTEGKWFIVKYFSSNSPKNVLYEPL